MDQIVYATGMAIILVSTGLFYVIRTFKPSVD